MTQAIPIGCTVSPVVMTSSAGYLDSGNSNPGLISSPTPGGGGYHVIDAGGGFVIFDGNYWVRRPLRLTNGTFIFTANTVMYFQTLPVIMGPSPCSQFGLPGGMGFMEVENAQVRVDNTLFTDDVCGGELWGGIYLRGNAVFQTNNTTRISNAHIGLASETGCTGQNTNSYSLRQTHFIDNVFGIWDTYKVATAVDVVEQCEFIATGTVLPNQYPPATGMPTASGQRGIFLDNDITIAPHDYSLATFKGNYFENLAEFGFFGTAANINIDNCQFFDIGNTSINIHSDINTAPTISNCFIQVRDAAYSGWATGAITGIQMSPIAKIIDCTFTGAGTLPPTVNLGARRIGVWLDGDWNGNPTAEAIQVESSRFGNLQEGIAINNNTDYWMTSELNTFEDNLIGINLDNSASAPGADFYARCNTFRRSVATQNLVGINVETNIGNPPTYLNNIESGTPGSGGPAGNSFLGLAGSGPYIAVNNAGTFAQYYGYGNFSTEDILGYSMPYSGINFIGLAYTPPPPSTTICGGLGAGVQRQAAQTQPAQLGLAQPNPATDVVAIPYELPEEYQTAELELREMVTGRTVSRNRLSSASSELQISMGSFAAGCYTYTLLVDGAAVATNKLVVIK